MYSFYFIKILHGVPRVLPIFRSDVFQDRAPADRVHAPFPISYVPEFDPLFRLCYKQMLFSIVIGIEFRKNKLIFLLIIFLPLANIR